MHPNALESLKALPDGSLTRREVEVLTDEIVLLRNTLASFVHAERPDEIAVVKEMASQVLGR